MDQTECWQLGSGRWMRDLKLDQWRLATTSSGTAVNDRIPAQDVARMVGGMRDESAGEWFPPEFTYSPRTGTPLQVTVAPFETTWVPPYGAAPLSDLGQPLAGGLRQTSMPLIVRASDSRVDLASGAHATLPALPPGRFQFLVHRLDVASPVLVAIDPVQGALLVLLPESKQWIALEHPNSPGLAGLQNLRGWRMEVVEGALSATLYFPTSRGLAAVTPTLVGLSYRAEYSGEGAAIGGPVAWANRIWLPLLNKNGAVDLVGKSRGAGSPITLPTTAPTAAAGFEAPVFDPLQVIWPSEEGQLVLRLDTSGKEQADWIPWPAGLTPRFSAGCPHRSRSGAFWQLCSRGGDGGFEFVQMGKAPAESVAVDAPRLTTGTTSYRNQHRSAADPREQPAHVEGAPSAEVVVPLIESTHRGAVIGLRIAAPHGDLALLESDGARQLAVLQLEAQDLAEVLAFGALSVTRPWLATLFVHDGHLWVHHPELAQPLGWRLESHIGAHDLWAPHLPH